jgi:hypothetical protein
MSCGGISVKFMSNFKGVDCNSNINVIRIKKTQRQFHKKFLFLFCTYNTVSITLKRVSKRSSFRYAFQEHLLTFLMLAVTHSGLLRDHCTSRHFKFKTYNYSSIYQLYRPLGIYIQNRKNIVLYSFYKPFCRTCLFIALVATLLVL